MYKTVTNNLRELGILGNVHRYAVKGEESPISLSKCISDTCIMTNAAVPEGLTDRAELSVKLTLP